jgi:lipopolysaccharide export system permease protein
MPFAMALLVFVMYYNMINVGQNWIANGKMHPIPFLLGLHGGVALLALMWLCLRHQQWHLRYLWRKTPAGSKA